MGFRWDPARMQLPLVALVNASLVWSNYVLTVNAERPSYAKPCRLQCSAAWIRILGSRIGFFECTLSIKFRIAKSIHETGGSIWPKTSVSSGRVWGPSSARSKESVPELESMSCIRARDLPWSSRLKSSKIRHSRIVSTIGSEDKVPRDRSVWLVGSTFVLLHLVLERG